jgi:hypothetical protein
LIFIFKNYSVAETTSAILDSSHTYGAIILNMYVACKVIAILYLVGSQDFDL